MHWRIEEWVDDECRNRGGKVYTVVEVRNDGRKRDVFETRDCEAAHHYAEACAIAYRNRQARNCDSAESGVQS